MKKLITLFLSIAVLAASSAVLYSCDEVDVNISTNDDDDDDDKKKDKDEAKTEDGTKGDDVVTDDTDDDDDKNQGNSGKDESGKVREFVDEYEEELIEVFEDEFGTGDDETTVKAGSDSITFDMKIGGVNKDTWTDEDTDDQMESFGERLGSEEGLIDELTYSLERDIDGCKVPDELETVALNFYTEDGNYLFTLTITNDGAECVKNAR